MRCPQIKKKLLKAVILSVEIKGQEKVNNLAELSSLLFTSGACTNKIFIQKLNKINGSTFMGKGKLEEVALYINDNGIDFVVVAGNLSPSSQKNMEKILNVRVIDRTTLILDIFAIHAKTVSSKIQVELAQLRHLLTRLTGMWTHLERQRGGIGMRGPGEKEIETDRRVIKDKISVLKGRLKKVVSQNKVRVKNRDGFVKVSLIGYTNVGKSTIMNILTKTENYVANKLFATLDTTVKKVYIDGTNFLLSDTVGFISDLPLELKESFRSTLEDLSESDLLLHVIDISNMDWQKQKKVVLETLKELNIHDKEILEVFNKAELLEKGDLNTVLFKKKLEISALKGYNINDFKFILKKMVDKIYKNKYGVDNCLKK